MSFSAIRPYFESKLEAMDFSLWPDGFATDNIPSNVLDRAYHVSLGPLVGVRQSQADQETESVATVRMYFKGFNDPRVAIDEAIEQFETFMKSCVAPSARTLTDGIKNVVFNEANIDPIDASNDNSVVVTATFTVRVILAV
jgi:hypothetical protein